LQGQKMKINFDVETRRFDQIDAGSLFLSAGYDSTQVFLKLADNDFGFGAVAFSEAPRDNTPMPAIASATAFNETMALVLTNAILRPTISLNTVKSNDPSWHDIGAFIISGNRTLLRCARYRDRPYDIDLTTGQISPLGLIYDYWVAAWQIFQSKDDIEQKRQSLLEFAVA